MIVIIILFQLQPFKFLKCLLIVDDTFVDAPIATTVSNWGAHGIGACLALLLKNEDVLHDKDFELRAIQECANAGAIEGTIGIPKPYVDGLSAEFHGKVIELLGTIIKSHIRGFKSGHEALKD